MLFLPESANLGMDARGAVGAAFGYGGGGKVVMLVVPLTYNQFVSSSAVKIRGRISGEPLRDVLRKHGNDILLMNNFTMFLKSLLKRMKKKFHI